MSTEDNKAIVRRYLEEILSAGHFELADTLFTPDMSEIVRRPVGSQRQSFPDFHVTRVEEQIAEGDKVVTFWTAQGTHRGEFLGTYTGRFFRPPSSLCPSFAMGSFAPSPLDPLSFALFEPLLRFELGGSAGLARRGQGRCPRLRL